MRMLFKIILLCVLALNLTSIPLTIHASNSSTMHVKGNISKFKEDTIESSEENIVGHSEEKQTIIKDGNLPKTGEKFLVWFSLVGVILVCLSIYISCKYKQKPSI